MVEVTYMSCWLVSAGQGHPETRSDGGDSDDDTAETSGTRGLKHGPSARIIPQTHGS